MVTHDRYMVRVTVTLDPIDVDLLDRLAALEESNRSAELRAMMLELRPMLTQLVATFEAAKRSRDRFSEAVAASGFPGGLREVQPEVERLQEVLLGSLARLEGAAAARAADEDSDPRPSNHGGHTPLTSSDGF